LQPAIHSFVTASQDKLNTTSVNEVLNDKMPAGLKHFELTNTQPQLLQLLQQQTSN